jgi:hypothetical protein
MGSKKKVIWVPKSLVTNLQGPKQVWVPKKLIFFCRSITKLEEGIGFLIVGALHMTGDARMFNSINTNDSNGYDSIIFGDNGKGMVKRLGKIAISNDMSISNVLLVESLNFNLLSVAQLCDLGFKCIFRVDDVEIISVDGSNLIFKGFRYENLYLVDFNASEAQLSTCLFTKSSTGWLWHRRLGHVGMKQLNRLVKHDLVRGLKDVVFEKDKLCSSCEASKQVGNTHPKKSIIALIKRLSYYTWTYLGQHNTLASMETNMAL